MAQPTITIAELRARHDKMTQSQLAELVGVRPQTINAWEKDITSIKAQHLLKLCDVLGATASDLLGV